MKQGYWQCATCGKIFDKKHEQPAYILLRKDGSEEVKCHPCYKVELFQKKRIN